MTVLTQWSTSNTAGIDVRVFTIANASTTPEAPSPRHRLGQYCYGAGGAEYIFVQASTTINFGDFIAIKYNGLANGLTSSNINASIGGCRIGMAMTDVTASLANSLTYIPAGAYFWAQTRGGPCRADASAGVMTTPVAATGDMQLFTTSTAGQLDNNTVILASLFTSVPPVMGIVCLSSTKPYVYLTWPRATPIPVSASLMAAISQDSNT